MIKFLTRTRVLTGTMPRLYVSCHPDDFEMHFRTICSDIFASHGKCAIFYEDDPAAPYDETELFSLLRDMRLIVVPVTRRLLSEKSRALDIELPFAARNNITILPIFVEPDNSGELTCVFNKSEVFSGRQYLNRYNRDPTTLRYKDKLSTTLNSFLVGDEEVKRIHDEFSSKIFLSYRKKDREHAKELMRRIHKVDICRDTAIWYDEYLIPGEFFEENIMSALKESDVFVMSVTSSFKEPGNYVADHEYPDAVRKNKPLVAADMKHFDSDSLDDLEEMYAGIKALMVDPDDADLLGVTLRQRLIEDAGITEDELLNDDGEHLYYIALAYINGIRTEPDPEKAARIFRMSAENGCCESWLKLIMMYRLGDGVTRDLDAALVYCEKAEEELKPLEGSSFRNDNTLADVYEEKGNIYRSLGNEKEMLNAYWDVLKFRQKMQKTYKDAPLRKYCESMLNFATILYYAGRFTEAGDLAAEFIFENSLLTEDSEASDGNREEDIEMMRIRARIYNFIVAAFIKMKRHSDAIRCAKARVDACERIEATTGDAEDLRDTADAYQIYANLLKNTDLEKANAYFDKVTEIHSRLAEYGGERPKTIRDAVDNVSIADNMLMRIYSGEDFADKKARSLYNEALDICEGLMDSDSRYKAIITTANIYRRFGGIEEVVKKSFGDAMKYFKKALYVCRNAEKEYRNDLQLMQVISGLLDKIGELYLKIDDLSSATQYFTDSLEIALRSLRIAKDSSSKHNLAKSYMRCAEVNKLRGHQPIADVNNRSALKILVPLAQETDDYRILEDLALANYSLAMSDCLMDEQKMDYGEKALRVYELLMEMTNDAVKYVNAHTSVQELINRI